MPESTPTHAALFDTTLILQVTTTNVARIEAILEGLMKAGYDIVAKAAPPKPNKDGTFAATYHLAHLSSNEMSKREPFITEDGKEDSHE